MVTLLAVLTILFGTHALAASQLGYGATKCSIYTAIQPDGGALSSNIESWSLGFLSGLNHASDPDGKSDKLRRHQPNRITAYLRSYCEAKSSETIEQAVNSYWISSVKGVSNSK